MTHLSPLVRAATAQLIEQLDAQLPGQLAALYLVGSIALGDYREGQSDVDFIAVLVDPPRHHAAALARIHDRLARDVPSLHCDGIYLQVGELSSAPVGSGVEAREGHLDPNSPAERHAVTWAILAQSGVALRGRPPDAGWIATDRAATMAYSCSNLEHYWRSWVDARRSPSSPGPDPISDDAVVWGCLGIARLHATIATGQVPSKSRAGELALASFPGHALIITESLRLRREPGTASLYRSPLSRGRDLIAFMDAVLQSG